MEMMTALAWHCICTSILQIMTEASHKVKVKARKESTLQSETNLISLQKKLILHHQNRSKSELVD